MNLVLTNQKTYPITGPEIQIFFLQQPSEHQYFIFKQIQCLKQCNEKRSIKNVGFWDLPISFSFLKH